MLVKYGMLAGIVLYSEVRNSSTMSVMNNMKAINAHKRSTSFLWYFLYDMVCLIGSKEEQDTITGIRNKQEDVKPGFCLGDLCVCVCVCLSDISNSRSCFLLGFLPIHLFNIPRQRSLNHDTFNSCQENSSFIWHFQSKNWDRGGVTEHKCRL